MNFIHLMFCLCSDASAILELMQESYWRVLVTKYTCFVLCTNNHTETSKKHFQVLIYAAGIILITPWIIQKFNYMWGCWLPLEINDEIFCALRFISPIVLLWYSYLTAWKSLSCSDTCNYWRMCFSKSNVSHST